MKNLKFSRKITTFVIILVLYTNLCMSLKSSPKDLSYDTKFAYGLFVKNVKKIT